jgi:hypothetical protein
MRPAALHIGASGSGGGTSGSGAGAKGKGKQVATAAAEEVLPPAPVLDAGRRLAAEEAVKLIMLLGQVRRGGGGGGHRRDILIRRVSPGTGGLEARRIVTRLGGLSVLATYTRSCYKGGHAAAAVDALTLMQGLCQVTRERPEENVVPSLKSLVEDEAAAPLHNEALRCLASLMAACGEREGAVLSLIRGGLPGILAKVLGRRVLALGGAGGGGPGGGGAGAGAAAVAGAAAAAAAAGAAGGAAASAPAAVAGAADPVGAEAGAMTMTAAAPAQCVMDTGARLVLWLCSGGGCVQVELKMTSIA